MINKDYLTNLTKNYTKEIIAFVMFLISFVPVFIWMWDRWFIKSSYYTHGILVPFITLYLIWQLKEELKTVEIKESRWGMGLIVFGVVIHILSSVMRVYFTSGFSSLIVLIGLILHFFGKDVFRKIAFPILFLAFMIPLPMEVITNMSFKLKLFAAEIATVLLNEMRIPAIREGSIIKMTHTHVVVDDVCSGLRSLISLGALGSIFAYWMEGGMGKRVILFFSTIPIAIITNVCRVIFLSGVSEIYGSQYAVGFVHDFSGLCVFALAFVLLYATGKLLE